MQGIERLREQAAEESSGFMTGPQSGHDHSERDMPAHSGQADLNRRLQRSNFIQRARLSVLATVPQEWPASCLPLILN